MKTTYIAGLAFAASMMPLGASAFAAPASQNVQILARDSHHRATEVEVDGQRYAVCSATKTDNCIDPRAAGLKFGNVPLNYWPGEPASTLHHSNTD